MSGFLLADKLDDEVEILQQSVERFDAHHHRRRIDGLLAAARYRGHHEQHRHAQHAKPVSTHGKAPCQNGCKPKKPRITPITRMGSKIPTILRSVRSVRSVQSVVSFLPRMSCISEIDRKST